MEKQSTIKQRYLRICEACELTGISEELFAMWRKRETGPKYVLMTAPGTRKRNFIAYPMDDLIAFMDAHIVAPKRSVPRPGPGRPPKPAAEKYNWREARRLKKAAADTGP